MQINETFEQIETNIPTKGNFKFAANRHSFKILSDTLYTNKPAAIIRELACNCWDSHIEAGQSRPFIVTLPGAWSPVLSFEDFGIGMSEKDIEEIYTSFFSSTKTTSNAVTGMFGLGSKTPFSYTDNFSVVSTVDGVCTTYLMYLDNGLPTYSIVSKVPTDACNGVKVSIDIKQQDVQKFLVEAPKQLSFFPEDAIEVRGSFHRIAWREEGGVIFADSVDYSMRGWFVKQGAVLYRLDNSDWTDRTFGTIFGNKNCILDFPIGQIEVTPSRETISLTDFTKNNIVVKMRAIADNYFESIWKSKYEGKKITLDLIGEAASEVRNFSSTLQVPGFAEIFKIASTTFSYKNPLWFYDRESRYGGSNERAKKTLSDEVVVHSQSRLRKGCLFLIDETKHNSHRINDYIRTNGIICAVGIDKGIVDTYNEKRTKAGLTTKTIEELAEEASVALGDLKIIRVSTLPAYTVSPYVNSREYRNSKTVYIKSGHSMIKHELTEEELENEFYYAWVHREVPVDNATQEHIKHSEVSSLDSNYILDSFNGKPVYYLTAVNKNLAKIGDNLVAEIKSMIDNATVEDAMQAFSHYKNDPTFADITFNESVIYKFIKYNSTLIEEARAILAKKVENISTIEILEKIKNGVYIHSYSDLGINFESLQKKAITDSISILKALKESNEFNAASIDSNNSLQYSIAA